MCKKFKVWFGNGESEILVADTRIDADCQAQESAEHFKTSVKKMIEVFDRPPSYMSSVTAQFNQIFGV